MSERTKGEEMVEIGVVFSIIIVFFFIGSTYTKTLKTNDAVDSAVVTIITAIVCGIILFSAFKAGEKWTQGFPLPSIEPGRYSVIAIGNDFIAEDQLSVTPVILKKGERKFKFYLLPSHKIEGISPGATLEVSEIPSSTKITIRK